MYQMDSEDKVFVSHLFMAVFPHYFTCVQQDRQLRQEKTNCMGGLWQILERTPLQIHTFKCSCDEHRCVLLLVSVHRTYDISCVSLLAGQSRWHHASRPAVRVLVCTGALVHHADEHASSYFRYKKLPRAVCMAGGQCFSFLTQSRFENRWSNSLAISHCVSALLICLGDFE